MIIDIPITFISIEDEGYHLIVDGEINGKAARLLIDTGASRSVFDFSRISLFFEEDEIDLEATENVSTGISSDKIKSELTYFEILKIGDLNIENYKAVILDMPHVNGTYEKLGLEAIDGIIGSDILMKYGAVIDFNTRLLEIRI